MKAGCASSNSKCIEGGVWGEGAGGDPFALCINIPQVEPLSHLQSFRMLEVLVQIFFLFSNFRKGRLLYIHPVGWSVGWLVDVTINFFQFPLQQCPSQQVPSGQCSSLQCSSGQYPSGQLFLATMSLTTMSLTTIFPRDNCSTRQLFLSTIFPHDNCSLRQLFKATIVPPFLCKGDCPSDDENQRNWGARIVANDHLDDPASSVLFRLFTNGHLQRGHSSE